MGGDSGEGAFVVGIVHHADLYFGCVAVGSVAVEADGQAVDAVDIEHRKDGHRVLVVQVALGSQLQAAVAAAVLAVPYPWAAVVHRRSAPSGRQSSCRQTVELLAVGEGDVGLEGANRQSVEIAVHYGACTFAVNDEIVVAVGLKTADDKALLAADGLNRVAADGHAHNGASAFGETGGAVFDSHAIGVEISSYCVPAQFDAMGCNVGDFLSGDDARTHLQVVDVEVIVVGVRVVGAEGYVSARTGVGGERNLLGAPRGGGIYGVDGREAGGIFGIVHHADLDVSGSIAVAAKPEFECQLVDVDRVDAWHHCDRVDAARIVGADV